LYTPARVSPVPQNHHRSDTVVMRFEVLGCDRVALIIRRAGPICPPYVVAFACPASGHRAFPHQPHVRLPVGYGCTKHDGFRCIARKQGRRVRLYSWPGNDLTQRFPLHR
jgi:hypothetical protein